LCFDSCFSLKLQVRVTTSDGKDLTTEALSTTNLFMHSMFDVLELYLNSKLVSSKNYYNYCAYLLTHLSYSKDYKSDILKTALYTLDSNVNVAGPTSSGWAERKLFIDKSKSLELCSPLFEDFLLQNKWVINNVDVLLKLKRAPVAFSLLATVEGNFNIEIQESVFYAKRIFIQQKILELHEKHLEREKALYPYISNQIKILTIPANASNAIFENIFPSNRLPRLILFGICESESVNGKITKNGFNFGPNSVSQISVSIDNVQLDYRTLSLNYSQGQYLLAYYNLIQTLNLENKSIGIDRNSYIDGSCFYAYRLNSGESNLQGNEMLGNLKIEITLSTPTTKQLSLILLSQTPSLISIDKYRTVELHGGIL
jgi:hypothetical protein